MKENKTLSQLTVNSIRMLGVQAVNEAKSGHPGIVLGAAPIIYALFKNHLVYNPTNPRWFNRDRFILSAGHGSALLYSMLHHAGYKYTINDLKQFRQFESKTPGHPEYDLDYGIETATGPLGQGLANGVGMAVAESFLRAKYNKSDVKIIDHYTYVLCGDGDLQEGVAQEALSFAGHNQLNKLIVLYDSNDIQLDSAVNVVMSENLAKRLSSVQWNYIHVREGDDYEAISKAIAVAKTSDKPTLIEIKTVIGFGASKAGTPSVHGAPLMADISTVASNLQWTEAPFTVPKAVSDYFTTPAITNGKVQEQQWETQVSKYRSKYPQLFAEIKSALQNEIFKYDCQLNKVKWESIISNEAQATRIASGNVLKLLSAHCPTLLGGSADLTGSTKALVNDDDFNAHNQAGRHVRYGVREFAMGAIVNGMTLHQGVNAFGSTFLVFSDYLKPALRLAALMRIPSLYIFSHDSIAVGEDGPTHQPIEQLTMLRTIPNFNVLRPCDIRETIGAYEVAMQANTFPSAIIITRQNLPQLSNSSSANVAKGAYIISPEDKKQPLDVVLLATGSEVSLAVSTKEQLHQKQKLNVRVVSMPSTLLFDHQSSSYQATILPPNVPKVAIEMGSSASWYKYVAGQGMVIGIDSFGASAPDKVLLKAYGFTTEQVVNKVTKFLAILKA